MDVAARLATVATSLKNGAAVDPVSVREFLGWFGAERRGYYIVQRIRETLDRHGLTTIPDVDATWIGGSLKFTSTENAVSPNSDPVLRVGHLPAANKKVETAAPDTELSHVTTLMLAHDFSQIPLVTGPKTLKGVVSWRSIGRVAALGRYPRLAQDAAVAASPVPYDMPMLQALEEISRNDFVIVQAADKSLSGIVTTSDVMAQYHDIAGPFMLLREIELGIRSILRHKFTVDQLKGAQAPGSSKPISSIDDLSLGEYVQLMSNPSHWALLKLPFSREVFVERITRVNSIRNGVMHFAQDGLDDGDIKVLQNFAALLAFGREAGRR
jgi:CBS domain-containing protein